MEIPGTPGIVKSAFNWKVLLVILVVALAVSWAMNKIMTTELTITDTAGNVIGKGTQDKKFNYSVKKS
ncbi:MAG: hypothetical protein ACOYO1_02475 [Bacteroidales bacterium]